MGAMEQNTLTALPQVEKLLGNPEILPWIPKLGRPIVTAIVRASLEKFRERGREGKPYQLDAILVHIQYSCAYTFRRRIVPVVNGTGTALHTNMGRAPIPSEVWAEAAEINCGYSNLEFNLSTGKRGKRSGIIPELLSALTGCESALVVNNNAAAVFLVLTALARGREVIVSRGEQVQIGGGFRIPEILAESGARIVEVGTTNMTTVRDYTEAITSETAAILIVHPSNFSIRGFTAKADLRLLAESVGGRVPLIVDQGSGVTSEELRGETRARTYLNRGADLVTFSADKALGGPQAGIIVGDKRLIDRIASHPLYRAVRPGKTILSLLEAFLIRKLNGESNGIVSQVLGTPPEELRKLGKRLQRSLPPDSVSVVPSFSTSGGGSAPDENIPSFSLELHAEIPAPKLLELLRRNDPPIVATIQKGVVSINLATVLEKDIPVLKEALTRILRPGTGGS